MKFDIKKLQSKQDKTPEEIALLRMLMDDTSVMPEPDPYKVNTITCSVSVNADVIFNLGELREVLERKIRNDPGFMVIVLKSSEKEFANSITFDMSVGDGKSVNIIFFQNGGITLTGANKVEYCYECTRAFINELKGDEYERARYEMDMSDLDIDNLHVTMMNIQYNLNFQFDADIFYTILTNNYPLFTTYNPETYPAVQIHYMYPEGVCRCEENNCLDKKKGNKCKRITLNAFHTGKVIISGLSNFVQAKDTYDALNEIIRDNYGEICQKSIENYTSSS